MLSEKQKYIIIDKYVNGYTINEIADCMKINKKTVIRWLKRYTSTNNVDGKQRITQKCTTVEEDNKITKLIEKNEKLNLQQIVNELKNNNIIISKTTVWRRLKENNYEYGNYLNKPKLSESHKQLRLEWGIKYYNYDWSKVVFSDEATIYLSNVGTN